MSTATIRNLSIAISLTFLSFFGIKAEAADWLMFGGKQLELDYFEMNGKQHRVPGETVYIDNFDNGKCTYQWSGTQDEGNKGTASASGTTLTMTDSKKNIRKLHITGYDSARRLLYTTDALGLKRRFRVRNMVTWGDLADRNLTLDYFERNGKRGYVPGEKLRIIPGVPILWSNCTYEWTGMQGGGSSLGIGCATTRGLTLVDKDDNKKSVIIYITGYDSTTSKLYTRDDTGLIRVFNTR